MHASELRLGSWLRLRSHGLDPGFRAQEHGLERHPEGQKEPNGFSRCLHCFLRSFIVLAAMGFKVQLLALLMLSLASDHILNPTVFGTVPQFRCKAALLCCSLKKNLHNLGYRSSCTA